MRLIHLVRHTTITMYHTAEGQNVPCAFEEQKYLPGTQEKYKHRNSTYCIRAARVCLPRLFSPARFHALSALPRKARRHPSEFLLAHELALSATEKLQQKRNVSFVSLGFEPLTFRQNLGR